MVANDLGVAMIELKDKVISLSGDMSIIGRTLVVSIQICGLIVDMSCYFIM